MAKEKAKTNDRLDLLPKRLRDKLTDKQKRVIAGYATTSKLRAVLRWKTRMAKCNITSKELSDRVLRENSRISEYLNLKVEPGEEAYLAIESALYKMGA